MEMDTKFGETIEAKGGVSEAGLNEAFIIEVLQNRAAILKEIDDHILSLFSYMQNQEIAAEEIRAFYLPNASVLREESSYGTRRVTDLSDLYLKFERKKISREKEVRVLLEELLERRERVEFIWVCYMILPHFEHTVLKMYYVDRRKLEDVAQELKCSVKTIYKKRKSALHRLLDQCASGLSPEVLLQVNKASHAEPVAL